MLKIIKLVTGEEVIGDTSSVDSSLILKKPAVLQLVPSRSDPTKASIALIPYAPYSDNSTLEINPDHVVWETKPIEELYNQYNSMFGTGIQIAR